MATKPPHPRSDADGDLGTAAIRWNNVYIAGDISDGTNAKSVAEIVTHIDAQKPHTLHLDKDGDTMTGDLTMADGKRIYLNSAQTAWFEFVEDSLGDRFEFWNMDFDSGVPVMTFP